MYFQDGKSKVEEGQVRSLASGMYLVTVQEYQAVVEVSLCGRVDSHEMREFA